jgi:hypothetical protein
MSIFVDAQFQLCAVPGSGLLMTDSDVGDNIFSIRKKKGFLTCIPTLSRMITIVRFFRASAGIRQSLTHCRKVSALK